MANQTTIEVKSLSKTFGQTKLFKMSLLMLKKDEFSDYWAQMVRVKPQH